MKISDIIKTSATLIAREDVVKYILAPNGEEYSTNTVETVDLFTRLTNLVIQELAEGLIVMKREIMVEGLTSVSFSEYGISPLDVLAVYDDRGEKLDFILSTYGVSVNKGRIFKIEYSYMPTNYKLTDTVGSFEKKVTTGLLSYGVLAEYCLTEGRFEEAMVWHERYVEGINKLIRPKNAKMKGRSFV